MKINSRTRVRISRRIYKEFGLIYTEVYKLIDILCKKYDLSLTSKRWNMLYFYPNDQVKLSLLFLQYPDYIINKNDINNNYF